MTTINHSATMTLGGEVSSSWSRSVGSIRGGTDSIKKNIASLKDAQRGVTMELAAAERAAGSFGVEGSTAVRKLARQHKLLKGEQKAVEAELRKAQREAAKLGKSGSADIDRLVEKSEELARREKKITRALDDTRRAHSRMAIEGSADVTKLRDAHAKFDSQLEREGRRLKRMQAWTDLNIGGRVSGGLKQIGSGLATVARRATFAGTALATMGLGGAAWFTKGLIETNAKFETMRSTLTTVEGSSVKAGKALGWVSEFGSKTPFEIEEVSEAFVKLRSRGLDPTDGTLRALGDTASAMGKDLDQAVEALADAVTGENERLKEFGVTAKTQGKKIVYSWTQDGRQLTKAVDKNNQELIRSTLVGIFNSRYEGAMQKRVNTWTGMMSNLSDQWTLFQLRIGEAGVFDMLKSKLTATLEAVSKWSADGTLERWAGKIADAYSWSFSKVSEGFSWVRSNWPSIQQSFAEFWETSKQIASGLGTVATTLMDVSSWASRAAGGAENLTIGLVALGGAKVLSPLVSLGKVGWDIVAWLARSNTLADALGPKLGGLGGGGKSLLKTPAKALLGSGVAGAGSVVGGAALAAAGGYAVGTAGLRLAGVTEKDQQGWGAKLYDSIYGSADEQLDAAVRGKGASPGATSQRVRNSLRRAQGGSHVDNRSTHNTFNIQGDDPRAIAAEVERVVGRGMRDQELASH